MDAEVAVVGVGSVGSMALWQLAERGIDAVGLEQFAPGHDRGAVGGDTRIFRLAYVEGERFLPLLRTSQVMWRELSEWSGAGLFAECGSLTIGASADPDMRTLIESAPAQGIEIDVLDQDATRERFPQHRLSADEVSVFDPQGGVLRADHAVLAASRRAQTLGARVVPRDPVRRIDVAGEHVRVESETSTWNVRTVVLTTGSWTGRFLPAGLKRHIEARRHLLTWFLADDTAGFTMGRFPPFVRTIGERFLYGTPPADGVTVKIGGVPPQPIQSADTYERRHSADETREISEVIRTNFRGLYEEPVRADAYTDLFTDDSLGLLGRLPQGPRVVVASGYSGRGFKLAPALGRAVADMVGGQEPAEVAFMTPDRFE